MPFTERFIELDGCRIRVRRGGRGSPLLYLHGANGAPAIAPFMERLAERFEVIVPEHPGFGASDEPEWLENTADLAYFYLDFLRHEQLREVHVVGSSLGGWVALEMAVRDTSRLRSLVLVGPAGLGSEEAASGDTFLWTAEEQVRNTVADQSVAEKLLAQPQDMDVQLKNRFTVARLAWEPRYENPFLAKWLHRIDVPTKIIWGEEDKIFPVAYVEAFRSRMPDAEIQIIAGCGHLPQVERPDQFCEVATRFIDKVNAGPGR